LVLKVAFLLFLLVLIAEGYFIFQLKNKPKTFSSLTFSQSSCIIFEEKFCQAGKKKQFPERGSFLLFSLPKGAKLFAPWDGIIFLNEVFFSPFEPKKKIASAHLFPPYSRDGSIFQGNMLTPIVRSFLRRFGGMSAESGVDIG